MHDPVKALLDKLQDNEPVQGILHTAARCIEVTTAEIQTAVESNPDHYLVKEAFNKVVQVFGHAPQLKHVVNAVDLQAVIENKRVQVIYTVKDGNRYAEKQLIEGDTRHALPSVSDTITSTPDSESDSETDFK